MVGLMALTIALAGCGKGGAGGDANAAATVNGEPVTRDELTIEARNSGAGDDAAAQQALLTQVVNRKLLAQEAIAQKANETPEFRLAEKKAHETALVEALMTKLAGDKARPDEAAVKAFVVRNPAMFGARAALTLDQIQVPAASVNGDWLRDADTLADAARILTERKVAFERGQATADTAAMPPGLLKVIAAKPREAFAIPQGDKLVISQVVARRPMPVPSGQVDALARAELRRRAYSEAAARAIADARGKAKVVYGAGFSAPAQ
jgi:EpsD family peptidyl-prolyl cis-trans isomerase